MANSRNKPAHDGRSASTNRTRGVQVGISVPLLVGTLVAITILIPGLYFWRARQVEQGAAAYVQRAEALAEAEQWNQSAEYLFLYLRMRPDDVDARIQLAETYERSASRRPQVERAVELYYQALAAAPADRRPALQVRLAELLIQAENFTSAEVEARKLLETTPADSRALRALALALYGQAEAGGFAADNRAQAAVGKALEDASRLNPGDVQLALSLANVYRTQPHLLSKTTAALTDAERAHLADQCLDRLVASDDQQASVYLARYQYRLNNRLPDARADLDRALQLGSDNVVVLLSAADDRTRQAIANGPETERSELFTEAAQLYERAIAAEPANERAYLGLGEIQAMQSQADQAVQTWEQGLKQCGPDSIGLNARLAELLISQDKLTAADARVARLEAVAATLRRQGAADAQLTFTRWTDLLKAQILLAQQQPNEAAELLRRVADGRKNQDAAGVFTFRALMLLGNLNSTQGQTEKALQAYDEAALIRPDLAAPDVAAATVCMAADQPDRAIGYLNKAIAISSDTDSLTLLAAATLATQLKLPVAERNWPEVERLLTAARQSRTEDASSGPWVLGLLEAEYLQQKQTGQKDHSAGIEAALAALRNSEAVAASSREGLTSLALAFERMGSQADTDRVLQSLQQAFPSEPDSYLVPVAILANRKAYDQARQVIERGLAVVDAKQQLGLQLGIVYLQTQAGQVEEAWQELNRLHGQDPANHLIVQRQLEFALEHRKFAEAEALERELSGQSNFQPSDWRMYQVRRLLAQATGPQDPKLDEAQAVLALIHKERPDSAGYELLSAQLAEHRGNLDRAAEGYEAAVKLGVQRVDVYERLIMLLYQLGRFRDAEQYLAELHDRSPEASETAGLEISLALKSGKLDQALTAAKSAVEQRPDDPLARIWLGQLLLADGQAPQAEQPLRKAVELSPGDPRAYGALFSYLVSTKQIDVARTTLEEFAGTLQASPAQRALMLATGYDLLGDHSQAMASFQEAEQLEPKNAEVLERKAAALAVRDPAAAEQALRRALELDPDSSRSRRMLAGLLSDRGGSQNWNEAVALLENGSTDSPASAADKRLQAIIYAKRSSAEHLAKAERILDDLIAENGESPNDRLLLAQVRDARGDTEGAREQYLLLVGKPKASADHIAVYVDWLLRHDDPQEAGTWLDKLEQLESNSLRVVSLRVQILQARRQIARIAPLVEETAERMLAAGGKSARPDSGQELRTSLTIGDLYYSVQQWANAERWYRRAHQIDPQQLGRLAVCLGRQGRIGEALDLYATSAANDSTAQLAKELATVLVQVRPTAAEAARAEPLLARAIEMHSQEQGLLVAVATWRLIQGRTDDACKLYRQVTELDPHNIDAWNDLAIALAEQPSKAAEGLPCIERAIELAGPRPNLLDSKATILLALGKYQEAVELLGDATSAVDADPRYYLHLAAGHLGAGDLSKARETLAIAHKRDLKRYVLTGTDNKLLAQLEAELR